MYQIPELLAPVGGPEQLKAAVENGADAVYMGTTMFNARINAGNFTPKEMKEAIKYAHMRGVGVHITMNTLLQDSELSQALRQAALVYEWGADALIVQDMGFAAMLHEHFPEIVLHLSTQGTVYNLAGVEEAAGLGFSRVVLARELALEEIKRIAEHTGTELEVFVHGALCMCYSGQCQMSRTIGGRSGNRGQCAQPCRLDYELYKEANPAKTGGDAGRQKVKDCGYLLSPKDLCTVDHIGTLAQAGVASLKIEGRMKSPEYVALVTGIYRKYLDHYRIAGEYEVSKEDRWTLQQIFSRGEFGTGYLFGNPGRGLLSGALPKHQGIKIGEVVSYSPSHKTAAVSLWTPEGSRTAQPLSLGDGVELHNAGLSGNVITYIRGDEIGYLTGDISPGDEIYKITDKALLEQARKSYQAKSGEAQKDMRKQNVKMSFVAHMGQPVSLSVCDALGRLAVREVSDIHPEPAMTRALDYETVKKQLEKTGGTSFRLSQLTVDMDQGISVRLSSLNELRRKALESFETKWDSLQKEARTMEPGRLAAVLQGLSAVGRTPKEAVEKEAGETEALRISYYLFSADEETLQMARSARHTLGNRGSLPVSRFYLPYEVFLKEQCKEALAALRESGAETVPFLPAVTRGNEDAFIQENLLQILDIARENGVSIGNICQLKQFSQPGIAVYGDYGLNFYNSSDIRLAGGLGMAGTVLSNEWLPVRGVEGSQAETEIFTAAAECGVELEVPIGGFIPAMISAHCPIGDVGQGCAGLHNKEKQGICQSGNFCLQDRKGKRYPILTRRMDCQMLLFNDKMQMDDRYLNEIVEKGARNLRIYGIDKKIFCMGSET